jgi:hypothetical protein
VFFKSNHPEVAASFTFLNRHHAIVFDFRLQMSILRRLLPKRVNVRLTRFLEDLRKARGFDFKQFHKKSARELRQGGSNYRCCIPALAGFVSPQSVAPDGTETYRKACPEQQLALSEAEWVEWIDIVQWSFYNRTVKWLALLILAASQYACTTLANRRDLYSPEPAPDSQEAIRQITARPQGQQTPAARTSMRILAANPHYFWHRPQSGRSTCAFAPTG